MWQRRREERERFWRLENMFEAHVKECTQVRKQTEERLAEILESLGDSVKERRDQIEKLHALAWKVLWTLLCGFAAAAWDIVQTRVFH